jgi:CheY-like chemotaxis protein
MAKILVVDDTANTVKFLSSMLSKEGYAVITASNGADGIARAEQESPDLILLDVSMPLMDGGMIKDALQQNPRTSTIPVLFLTGLITPEEEELQKDSSGESLFISKMSDNKHVLEKVAKALGKI